MKQNKQAVATEVVRQSWLRPELTPVGPNKDYEVFARQMNRLCVQMTHPRRHRDRLAKESGSTPYTEPQAKQIIKRIDAMLAQTPAAIKQACLRATHRQAHERIIGERPVPSAEKILRVYESDVKVLVRGKASGEVEFGHTLMISETITGVISDWQLYREGAPPEWRQFAQSLERQNQFDLSTPSTAASTNRGFSTKRLRQIRSDADIYDATCPRAPPQLQERMNEPQFVALQRRRASTEGRIAILKQRPGGRLRAKGFTPRYLAVAWSVLATTCG